MVNHPDTEGIAKSTTPHPHTHPNASAIPSHAIFRPCPAHEQLPSHQSHTFSGTREILLFITIVLALVAWPDMGGGGY